MKNINKILVIKMRYIGDVVLTTPLLYTLKQGFAHVQLDVLVNQSSAYVLKDNPYIQNVWAFDYDFAKIHPFYGVKFAARIRRQKYDLVIHLTNNDRTALFTRLSGARLRMGYPDGLKIRNRLVYTQMINSIPGAVHTVDHHLKAAEFLGLPIKDKNPEITVSLSSEYYISQVLKKAGLDKNTPFAIIHPGARRWYKSWPLERFARLGDKIAQMFGVKIVLSGSPADQNACGRIKQKMTTQAIDLSGQISLEILAAFIQKAVCLIGNDSAPIHIATGVKTPTIALFGPTQWEIWGPRRSQDKVLAAEFSCRPCGHSKQNCPYMENYCMSQISFDAVWNAVKTVMAASEKS